MTDFSDERGMAAALAVAAEALGSTAPNPAVGAVVVRDGQVLGRGHTQPVGGPHAEVMALRDTRENGHDPRGATVYVTLEPCNHHGRTPPCTEALLGAGIRRVVVGVVDPTEPMCGRSLERLRGEGTEVELGVLEDRCAASLLGWTRAVRHGLPEVTLKIATSADGAVATESGESQWITGEPARAAGRALRGSHDAILVGIGTVLADDPRLTTRIEGRPDPVPVVLDTEGRFPRGCALDRPETLVFSAPGAPFLAEHAHQLVVPRSLVGVELEDVLRALVVRGLHRVLVEGGAGVARSFVDGGWTDQVVQFVSGTLLPGGRRWLGGPSLQALADARRLTLVGAVPVGDDLQITWRARHRLEEA